jgi:hypothetical protein
MFQPIRRFLSFSTFLVLGILLLPHLSSAQGVTSSDSNFTVSTLTTGLTNPANGVVFRHSTNDLVVSQYGANKVSLVNATSGAVSDFPTAIAQATPDEVAVRQSDGLVAVKTHTNGPIDLYNSDGTAFSPSSLSFPGTATGGPTGLAFDGAGNLYMADSGGEIWIFSAPGFTSSSLWVNGLNPLEGLFFSAAPLPSGSIYAISFTTGTLYNIPLDGSPTATTIATVAAGFSPVGVAVDPLLGDLYISESSGSAIMRVPPGGGTPSTFATGFTATTGNGTYGMGFDTMGNLYVNDFGAGKVYKFTRASSATAKQNITPGTLTFTNPSFTDQVQTMTIPTTASKNGAATIQDIFVVVDLATLNARLAKGSTGDTIRFGSPSVPTSVPKGTVGVPIPSAGVGKTVVTIQKCYSESDQPFDVCPLQGNGIDLIQLTSHYNAPSLPPNPAFLIDYDTPPNNNTLTDITTGFSADPTGSGGTKGLCSGTIVGDEPPIITITTPASGGTYSLGGTAPASYACTDPQPQPSGFPTCAGTVANGGNINTGSLGTKTFTVSSMDSLGASANQSVNYTVVLPQAFVQQPINPDGSSVFSVKRGVIPVKFTLSQINVAACALPPATIVLTRTAGTMTGTVDESIYLGSADSGPNFRISSCQYVYNLAASALGVGTYQVDILINGVVVGSGFFKLS